MWWLKPTLLAFSSVRDGDNVADGINDMDVNTNVNDNTLPVNIVSGETDSGNDFLDSRNMVSIDKTHDPDTQHNDVDVSGTVNAGDILTYTVRVTNNSAMQVNNVVIEDILLNVDLVETSCIVGDAPPGGDTTAPIENSPMANKVFVAGLGAGDSVACNFQYTVLASDELSCRIDNTAQASGSNFPTVTDSEMVGVAPARPNAVDDSMMFTDQTSWQINILTNDATRDGTSPVLPANPNIAVDVDTTMAGIQTTRTVGGAVPGVWTYNPATGILDFNPDTDPVPGVPSTLLPDPLPYRLIETIPQPTACASPQEDMATVTFTIVTTPVTLSYFHADAGLNGEVVFTWKTEMEVGTLGYNLYARGEDGWYKVNDELILAMGTDSFEGREYRFAAYNLDSGWFALVDVSMREELTVHGPYRADREYGEDSEQVAEMNWDRVRAAIEGSTDDDISASVERRLQRMLEADERAARW